MIGAGSNIAIKTPAHLWMETVAFYRDRVGLIEKKATENTVAFEFGGMTLWIDRVDHQSQTDVWLELICDDPDNALAVLQAPNRDSLEPLDGIAAHWTSDPAGTVLLVRRKDS